MWERSVRVLVVQLVDVSEYELVIHLMVQMLALMVVQKDAASMDEEREHKSELACELTVQNWAC